MAVETADYPDPGGQSLVLIAVNDLFYRIAEPEITLSTLVVATKGVARTWAARTSAHQKVLHCEFGGFQPEDENENASAKS